MKTLVEKKLYQRTVGASRWSLPGSIAARMRTGLRIRLAIPPTV